MSKLIIILAWAVAWASPRSLLQSGSRTQPGTLSRRPAIDWQDINQPFNLPLGKWVSLKRTTKLRRGNLPRYMEIELTIKDIAGAPENLEPFRDRLDAFKRDAGEFKHPINYEEMLKEAKLLFSREDILSARFKHEENESESKSDYRFSDGPLWSEAVVVEEYRDTPTTYVLRCFKRRVPICDQFDRWEVRFTFTKKKGPLKIDADRLKTLVALMSGFQPDLIEIEDFAAKIARKSDSAEELYEETFSNNPLDSHRRLPVSSRNGIRV